MFQIVKTNNQTTTTMFQALNQRGAEAMAYFAVATLTDGEALVILTPTGSVLKVMLPL